MRIKFSTWIQECSFVAHLDGERFINADTHNGLYTIVFKNEVDAKKAYIQILERGYYDASNNEYSNVMPKEYWR